MYNQIWLHGFLTTSECRDAKLSTGKWACLHSFLCSWLLAWGDRLSASCSDFHSDCLQPWTVSWDGRFSSESFCVNIFHHSDRTEIDHGDRTEMDRLPSTISRSSLPNQMLMLVIVLLHKQLMISYIASDILLVSNKTTCMLQAKSPATFKIVFATCRMRS